MPCYDPRDDWDHTHSYEIEKLLDNLKEVVRERRMYSEDCAPFKTVSNEATRVLCSYLRNKSNEDIKIYSKQLQHWWIDHSDWDKERSEGE